MSSGRFSSVFAHEKVGVAGKRYVINVARIVLHMSDEDFHKATFAQGKTSGKRKPGDDS